MGYIIVYGASAVKSDNAVICGSIPQSLINEIFSLIGVCNSPKIKKYVEMYGAVPFKPLEIAQMLERNGYEIKIVNGYYDFIRMIQTIVYIGFKLTDDDNSVLINGMAPPKWTKYQYRVEAADISDYTNVVKKRENLIEKKINKHSVMDTQNSSMAEDSNDSKKKLPKDSRFNIDKFLKSVN